MDISATALLVLALVVLATGAGAGFSLINWARHNAAQAALALKDQRQGLWETWARQAVRYAEEFARQSYNDDGVKMADVAKHEVADAAIVKLAEETGEPAPPAAVKNFLIRGALVTERRFMEEPRLPAMDSFISPVPVELTEELLGQHPELERPGDRERMEGDS